MTWRPTLANGGHRYRLSEFSTESGNGLVLDEIETGQHLTWEDFQEAGEVQILPVHGESHHAAQLQDPDFAPGRRLQLYWELTNPADKNAVSVRDHTALKTCGYVPRDRAEAVSKRLGQGATPITLSMWQEIREGARVSLRIIVDWSGTVEPKP